MGKGATNHGANWPTMAELVLATGKGFTQVRNELALLNAQGRLEIGRREGGTLNNRSANTYHIKEA